MIIIFQLIGVVATLTAFLTFTEILNMIDTLLSEQGDTE